MQILMVEYDVLVLVRLDHVCQLHRKRESLHHVTGCKT
jgi:hypothetical protein